MKKPLICILLAVTALLSVFTIGFYLGRNQSASAVQLSIPETMLTMPTAPAVTETVPETTALPDVPETTAPAVIFPVNINTAGLYELMELPNIGQVIAQRIIDYRETHGDFQAVEELMNVEGIGEKRMEQIIDLVTTGG